MRTLLLWLMLIALAAADPPPSFSTSQQAVDALTAAVRAPGQDSLLALFGPKARDLLSSGDEQADANARQRFLGQLEQKVELVSERGATFLYVGAERWPFPIPLQERQGQWSFDAQAGARDLLARRIGTNELNAIAVCRSVGQAEREYATRDWNGNRVLEYARRIRSTPGQKDGLYWAPKPGALESPLGPLLAQAQSEGYSTGKAGPSPYHGYFFRILTGQTASAPGGAYSYIINGNMVAGYAVLAWPAKWGNSGVMTFMLGPNGDLYERNLGADTPDLVTGVEAYDPGAGWQLVQEDR